MAQIAEIYVERELSFSQRGTETRVTEADILSLALPLIVLGDPGMGKSKLTERPATRLGAWRISAGALVRSANLEPLKPLGGLPILIDGLDELTASSGASAVDEVLKKLSAMGYPPFILFCRAADWNGSADRHKIWEDYGVEPTTARLEPFSRADAKRFLNGREGVDAEQLLEDLDRRDLSEFYANPLTLALIAEIAADKQGLPNGRADLLDRASRLLVREVNPIHQRGVSGMSDVDGLIDSAGAIFAHLLLSGSSGIADRPPHSIPLGFVAIGDLADIPGAPLTAVALKSRLFRSNEENLLVPYHRVVAEFLAARWLAKRLDAGLSERRIVQGLMFGGGVPTALRGLYAWFGHFAPRMTEACIRTDPYAALRYGDAEHLSLQHARLLLRSLASLASEDPYFRSDDWGRRAVAGLARPELKPEILQLVKQPDRHVHLSTIVLEALPGSTLTREIVPELTALVEDENAIYLERYDAAKALGNSKVAIDWAALIRKLRMSGDAPSKRLALEVMGQLDPNELASDDICDALLDYHGVFREERAGHVIGSDYLLLRRLSATQSAAVLDRVAERITAHKRSPHWRMGYHMGWAMHRLINAAIGREPPPGHERLWCWLRLMESESGSDEDRSRIGAFLKANAALRRGVQRLSFSDDEIDGAPWMAIVHDLPRINPELAVTPEDAVAFLDEIAGRKTLANFDIELWTALLHFTRLEGFVSAIEQAARRGIERHPELQRHWDEVTAPPKFDWRKEEQRRQEKSRRDKQRRFRQHRAEFAAHYTEIANGTAFRALSSLANAYLDRYSDLHHEGGAIARLQYWLGDDLTQVSLKGFVRVLFRDDLPTAKQISETHAEGKTLDVEPVLICGTAELVRTGQSLSAVSRSVLMAVLAAWWEYSDLYEQTLGDDLGKRLEGEVFTSDEEITEFLTIMIEPRIKAGREHIPGLYQLGHDERYRRVAGRLAFAWLKAYPNARLAVQNELLDISMQFAPRDQLKALIHERIASLKPDQSELRPLWMAALFLTDFETSEIELRAFCNKDPAHIWAIRALVRVGRQERWRPLSIRQLEFIVEQFAERWPPAEHPSSTRGDQNAWDATEFIRTAIGSIGIDSSEEASEALARLVASSYTVTYRDQIKHVRAQQQRLRRDTEYLTPSFSEVKSTLAGGLPETIDDLKALTLDAMEAVQLYLRQGDTSAWKPFWSAASPCDENTCRDRLLDLLRGHIPKAIAANPETRMPDAKRADVAVIYNGMGLPVEIKGQWHKNVWDAPSEQLIELYTKDYRANGRGIYLVLWFGPVAGKNLPSHPDKKLAPGTPEELRQMLRERLYPSERSRVEIVVLNVSPTWPDYQSRRSRQRSRGASRHGASSSDLARR